MTTLYPSPLDAILGAINTANGLSLVESQYTFGTPAPWTDSTGVNTLNNTEISVTAIEPTSPYQGSVNVQYTRLNLADVPTLIPTPIRANGLLTTVDLANWMTSFYGLNLGSADVQSDTLSLTDGAGSVVLTALADSLGWIGTVTLDVELGNFDLATEATTTTLPGLMYPAVDETKPYAALYSYWRDFSAQSAQLAAIEQATPDWDAITAILVAITGDGWIDTGASRFSLENAVCNYNGAVSGAGTIPNPAYVNVMLITLDDTASLGLSGQLVIHYDLVS